MSNLSRPWQMTNEELADWVLGENERNGEMLNEVEDRLRTAMHWLPMTDDAVFEDGGLYLLYAHGCYTLGSWSKMDGQFVDEDFFHHYVSKFTHYARITEPNK